MVAIRQLLFAATVLSANVGSSNAATVISGSDLLVGSHLTQVESWLVNDPQLTYNGSLTFTNIFDKAPGDTANNFHAAANGKGPTVVLMEAKAAGSTGPYQIIGGFNPQSWSSINNYNITSDPSDRTGFIFNLTTLDRRDQHTGDLTGQNQTYNHANFGPVFGGGFDIGINFNLSTGYLFSWSYCIDSTATCSNWDGYVNLLGALYGPDSIDVTFGRIEVFTIAETSEVPLPAALPLFATVLAGGGLMVWRRSRKRLRVAV